MRKFICVLCDERKDCGDAHILSGKIGICRECFRKLSKTAPNQPYKGTRNISYIMSPFEYTGSLRKAVIDFKFRSCRKYAELFAELMYDYLDTYSVWEQFDFIVPVPLHKKRLLERGYNQSELISEYVAKHVDIPLKNDLLVRSRATVKQSTLQGLDRIKNVQDAFCCTEDISDASVLLFDDICTTGSTLQACASALESAGAKYICALTFTIQTVKKLPPSAY